MVPEQVSQHGSLSFCAHEMPRPSLLAPPVVPHCAPGAVDSAQALTLCRATTSAKCTGVRVARRLPWCDCGRQCGDRGGHLQDKSGLHMLGSGARDRLLAGCYRQDSFLCARDLFFCRRLLHLRPRPVRRGRHGRLHAKAASVECSRRVLMTCSAAGTVPVQAVFPDCRRYADAIEQSTRPQPSSSPEVALVQRRPSVLASQAPEAVS